MKIFRSGSVMLLGLFLAFVICSPFLPAQNASGQPNHSVKPFEWKTARPEDHGLDPDILAKLTELIEKGEEYPRLHSLLIIRNGSLVLEEYFNGWKADKLHTLQSVSKSFTSALVGIAIERGEFHGVDEKILGFFPEMKGIANMDDRKRSIRLRDLLTMRSGTDYNENGPDSPHHQLNRQPTGWDKFYLDRPMISDPGTNFLYDSGGVILMSAMLKNRTSMHADAYAKEYLFKPLDIKKNFWLRNREGHSHTGGGLGLISRDTAKLGLLYLNKGRWEGKQIVPEAWIRESFTMHVAFENTDSDVVGYGYLWWILKPDPQGNGSQNIYAAMGFKAQYIFVIPEHNMVVVVHGDTRSSEDQRQPRRFLYSHILPAVNRDR